MTKTLLLRMVGMIAFAIIGAWLGSEVGNLFTTRAPSGQTDQRLAVQLATVLFLAGLAFGAIITPYIVLGPYHWFRSKIKQIPAQYLLAGTIGLGIGLIIAALLALPLSLLPAPFGQVLPFIGAVLFAF